MSSRSLGDVGFVLLLSIVALGCGGGEPVADPPAEKPIVPDGPPVTDRAPVDGGDVFYVETPTRHADGSPVCPVVLIGGGSAMDVRQWSETESWLRARHTVVQFDPRGVGRSPLPTVPYSDAADLAALLDDLEIERVVVVGNSSAAGVALEFALSYPERTRAVVAVAPFVPGYPMSDSMMERVQRIGASAADGADAFIDTVLADPHFLPSPDRPEARVRARKLIADNFESMAGADVDLAVPLEPPLMDRLGEIEAPVLVVVGALDHADLLERSAFVGQAMPDARVVTIPRAGHTVHVEQPLAFGRELQAFLNEVCE